MKKNRAKPAGMNVGSATVVMMFAVLCLTIFAVLALLTADNDLKMADRSAASIKAYYAAEEKAAGILDEIKTGKMPDGVSEKDGRLSYSVPIDDRQKLDVIIDGTDKSIIQWKSAENGTWQPDDSIEVWDGD